MKYLLVLVVVLGFACGSEEEDLGLQGLVDTENDMDSVDFSLEEESRQTTLPLDPALIIGNVISALNNLNISDPNSIIQDILKALTITGGTTATLGGLAGLTGVKSIFDVLVSGILGLISAPIAIANMVLSLVGLVVLIIFLIDGGDFGSLLGGSKESTSQYYRSMGSTFAWMPEMPSFNIINNPIVESVSKAVFAAFEKYDL